MKRQMYPVRPGILAALFILIRLSALGQQPDATQTADAPPKPAAKAVQALPPIIQLNSRPREEQQDPMILLNNEPEHAAPLERAPGYNLPEMVDDGNGGKKIARAKESFSNLTLEGSELIAQEPVFGSREEKPTFIRELWQLRWRPNDPIDLYIILPRNVKKPPVVLYLYGFPNDTDRFKNDSYCERVTQNGTAVIGFVSALTGHRYANRPFKQWFISELPESLASSVHDVQMILNQLKTRQDLDLSRIGMFGQGSGAAITIMAAAVDPRVEAIDLLDPWGDWPEWFAKVNAFPESERAAYLRPEFLKNLDPLEPLKYLPALNDRKLRIQFVQQNGEPEEAVRKLTDAAPASAEIHSYRSSKDMYDAYSGGRLFSWMAKQLDAESASAAQAELVPQKHATASEPAKK